MVLFSAWRFSGVLSAGSFRTKPAREQARKPLVPPKCYCGRQGCIESWLSGPALAFDHYRTTTQRLTPPQIVAGAENGNGECSASLARYEQRAAKALAQVINILDPDVIVLGGGLSNIERFYNNIPSLWTEHVFSDQVRTRLCQNRHGDSSGVRGAAWLWGTTCRD